MSSVLDLNQNLLTALIQLIIIVIIMRMLELAVKVAKPHSNNLHTLTHARITLMLLIAPNFCSKIFCDFGWNFNENYLLSLWQLDIHKILFTGIQFSVQTTKIIIYLTLILCIIVYFCKKVKITFIILFCRHLCISRSYRWRSNWWCCFLCMLCVCMCITFQIKPHS